MWKFRGCAFVIFGMILVSTLGQAAKAAPKAKSDLGPHLVINGTSSSTLNGTMHVTKQGNSTGPSSVPAPKGSPEATPSGKTGAKPSFGDNIVHHHQDTQAQLKISAGKSAIYTVRAENGSTEKPSKQQPINTTTSTVSSSSALSAPKSSNNSLPQDTATVPLTTPNATSSSNTTSLPSTTAPVTSLTITATTAGSKLIRGTNITFPIDESAKNFFKDGHHSNVTSPDIAILISVPILCLCAFISWKLWKRRSYNRATFVTDSSIEFRPLVSSGV